MTESPPPLDLDEETESSFSSVLQYTRVIDDSSYSINDSPRDIVGDGHPSPRTQLSDDSEIAGGDMPVLPIDLPLDDGNSCNIQQSVDTDDDDEFDDFGDFAVAQSQPSAPAPPTPTSSDQIQVKSVEAGSLPESDDDGHEHDDVNEFDIDHNDNFAVNFGEGQTPMDDDDADQFDDGWANFGFETNAPTVDNVAEEEQASAWAITEDIIELPSHSNEIDIDSLNSETDDNSPSNIDFSYDDDNNHGCDLFKLYEVCDVEMILIDVFAQHLKSKIDDYNDNTNCMEDVTFSSLINEQDTDHSDSILHNVDEYLWKFLRVIEETNALSMQWNVSDSLDQFLQSLNIDANTLVNSKLPAFARQLGSDVLMPRSNDGSRDSPPTMSSGRRTSRSDHPDKFNDSLSVPPVEFDWNTSGLINPLNTHSRAELLDLDYFVSDAGNKKDSVLRRDLEQLGLSEDKISDVISNKNNASINTKTVFEQLMKGKSSMTASPVVHKLDGHVTNEEVLTICESLPNLSFMLSPVLMFPVEDS